MDGKGAGNESLFAFDGKGGDDSLFAIGKGTGSSGGKGINNLGLDSTGHKGLDAKGSKGFDGKGTTGSGSTGLDSKGTNDLGLDGKGTKGLSLDWGLDGRGPKGSSLGLCMDGNGAKGLGMDASATTGASAAARASAAAGASAAEGSAAGASAVAAASAAARASAAAGASATAGASAAVASAEQAQQPGLSLQERISQMSPAEQLQFVQEELMRRTERTWGPEAELRKAQSQLMQTPGWDDLDFETQDEIWAGVVSRHTRVRRLAREDAAASEAEADILSLNGIAGVIEGDVRNCTDRGSGAGN